MTEGSATALTEASRPCSACGKPVDPLRASRVAHIRDRFRYFCSPECRTRFDMDVGATPLPVARTRSLSHAVQEAKSSLHAELETPRVVADGGRGKAPYPALEPPASVANVEFSPAPEPSPEPLASDPRALPGAGGLLLMLAGLGGVLAAGLTFAGP